MNEESETALNRAGIGVLVGTFVAPFIQIAMFFLGAGRVDLPRAWLYLAVSLPGMFGGIALVARANPELVNRRGLWRTRKDTRPWDRRLLITYGLWAFYVVPVVSGLDVGRFEWSHLGTWAAVVGTLLFCLGSILIAWAMLANAHFEVTVRIQTDRGHKVVTSGPYAMVRHPGYLGLGLWAFGTPLILGSACGLIPAAVAVATLVARTALEDRTLRGELPGYADYARRVRYRLLPCLW
jgi:protein-S-isoprenylcysteine O-methyltransferase Ste14